MITGATSGYGLATAKKFKDNGDTVIIVSRDKPKVESTVAEYGFADGCALNVMDYDGWHNLKKTVKMKYGRIDVLVNNAGGGVAIADVTEQTKENYDFI